MCPPRDKSNVVKFPFEIRPVLSLRHRYIGEFTTKYNVNLEWLLEGEGRIFKKDPEAE